MDDNGHNEAEDTCPLYEVGIVDLLATFGDPLGQKIWNCEPVTRDLIEHAIQKNHLMPVPLNWPENEADSRHYHAARVAFLTLNPSDDPISIEVECPSLGLYETVIEDGWHRFAAAVYRGDEVMHLTFGGGVMEFFEMFPSASARGYAPEL